ncbi:MAG: hypothetical protein J6B85_13030 [Lachnospiraceae bacterium]|nr:hypothetical protein [Lachnospiraceae bacterium]
MGYFDSPKNRAIWEIELKELKKEKQNRRLAGEEGPRKTSVQAAKEEIPGRERTSYKELLAEENAARGFKASGGRSRSVVLQQEKQNVRQMRTPER